MRYYSLRSRSHKKADVSGREETFLPRFKLVGTHRVARLYGATLVYSTEELDLKLSRATIIYEFKLAHVTV